MKKEELKELIKSEFNSLVNEGKTRWKAKLVLTGEKGGGLHAVSLYIEKSSKPSKKEWEKELNHQWDTQGNKFLSLGARERMGGIKSFKIDHVYDSNADVGAAAIYNKKRKGGGYGYAGD
jgi:hypothetical protein